MDFSTQKTKVEYVNKMPSEERVLSYFHLFFPCTYVRGPVPADSTLVNWYYEVLLYTTLNE